MVPRSRIPRRFATAALGAWLLAGACARSAAPTTTAPTGPGAYDVIKLGRISDEIGPVYFAHGLHADLKDLGGRTIACERCHAVAPGCAGTPPRGCANCHLPHDHTNAAGPPST